MYSHSSDLTAHITCVHCTLVQDELCAEQHSFIDASCLTLCCTREWALPHLLSLLPLLCHCRLLLRTQTCCPRIQLFTVKIHGKKALLRNTALPQVTSPKRIEPNRTLVKPQITQLTTRMTMNKLVSNSCPTANRWYTQLTTRQKA